MWIAGLLIGVLVTQVHQASAMDYKGNSYSVQELSQEFSSPGAGDPANYAPWAEEDSHPPYVYPGGGNYVEQERPYMMYPASDYPAHYVRYHYSRPPMEDSHIYQESMPSIHTYRPSFTGKDYNEYPHILPPGGKSIEQLQQEADFRMKKIYFESRENQKTVGEKIKKLRDTYGYGTIGYPGYTNSIKYDPIDLGTHNAVDLGSTLDGPNGNLQLPVQTVTVTKTLGVRVPQPYPVRQAVPVPAPYPVPVTAEPHFDPETIHASREVKEYLDAFASEFSDKPSFAKPETIVGKSFRYGGSKRESKSEGGVGGSGSSSTSTTTTTSTTPRSYSGFVPSFGVFPSRRPRTSGTRVSTIRF